MPAMQVAQVAHDGLSLAAAMASLADGGCEMTLSD